MKGCVQEKGKVKEKEGARDHFSRKRFVIIGFPVAAAYNKGVLPSEWSNQINILRNECVCVCV